MYITVIFLIGALIIIGILFKIIKSIFLVKILMRIAALIFIVLLGMILFTGFSVYNDYKDFAENFPNSKTLFIIEHKGESMSGFVLDNNSTRETDIDRIDISNIKEDYPDNVDELLEEYYKIVVIDTVVFKDMKIEIENQKVSFADVEEFLDNDTISLDDIKVDLSNKDTQEVKDYLLGLFTVKLFESPRKIIGHIRDDNIIFIEETIIFKLIKDAPKAIMGPLFEKGFDNIFIGEDSKV